MKFRSQSLELKEIEPGILELQFHSPHTANFLNATTLKSLDKALHIIQSKPEIKGLIITSDKQNFLVGADVNELQSMLQFPRETLQEWINYTNNLLNQYENLPFPTVSVISGYALGGGFEFSLATDFRVADSTAVLGLPITKLGIMPALGGSVRLPRLIGVEKAINLITKNISVPASCALKLGMIDRISDKENLIRSALVILKEAIHGKLDWQQSRQIKQDPIDTRSNKDPLICNTLHQLKEKKASTHYPANKVLIASIEKSAYESFNDALKIESDSFLELAFSAQAKALHRVHCNEQFVKYRNMTLIGKDIKIFRKIGVLGSNLIGSELAVAAAQREIKCILNDTAQPALTQGKNYLNDIKNNKIHFYNLNQDQKQKLDNNIQQNLLYTDFSTCQIIIDTTNENSEEKSITLRSLEENTQQETILITNTPSYSITSLGANLIHSERHCGVHILHPASKTTLMEIIKGDKTSLDTIKAVVQLAMQIGKVPIMVNDSPGFFINRVLLSYLSAFCNLATTGINITDIDNAMEREFGWSKGPGKLIDLIGIDVVYRAFQQLTKHYPISIHLNDDNILDNLYQKSSTGIKSLSGFYQYQKDEDGKIKIIGLSEDTKQFSPTPKTNLPLKEIIYRLMIPMMNEVTRCLEEEVITTPEEGDLALVRGTGFPAFRGGAFHLIDQIGIPRYLSILEHYEKFGKEYQAPELLHYMHKNSMRFYPIQTVKFNNLKEIIPITSA